MDAARALYSTCGSRLSALGMDWLAEELETLELWPDTILPLEVFESMTSQWRYSQTGKAIGLRYEAIPFDAFDIAPADRKTLLQDLRHMERAARDVINA